MLGSAVGRGARRSGRDRALRRRDRADGRVARHGRRRRRRAAVRRRRPAVPRRAGRRRSRLQLVEHALEAFARTSGVDAPRPGHRTQRPPPGRGRVQGPRPGASRRRRPGSASPGSGVDEGLDVTRAPAARPRVAVVDYGAGNLVSIDQALGSVGADVVRRSRPGGDPGRRPARRARASARRRRRWIRLERRGLVDRDPRLDRRPGGRTSGSASGSSSCSRAATRTARRRSASSPGRTALLDDAPTLPHIGWNQVERTREHPLFAGIRPAADFYFVHSYAGVPAGPDADGGHARHDQPRRGPSSAPSPAGPRRRRPVPSRAERRGRPAAARQRRRARPGRRVARRGSPARSRRRIRLMLRRRVIPCLDVADGRVVKGTRFVDLVDEGDPPELAERYAARGRRRAGLPRHHRRAGGPRHAPRHRRADRPPGVHPADGRWRRPERRATCATCSGPAPTRSP